MEKVLGLGGVFLKSKDPKALTAWYVKHLGVPLNDGYVMFMPGTVDGRMEATAWSTFPADTDYFAPSDAPFMFNYRVGDLDAMLTQLRKGGVELVGEPTDGEYGRFAWGLDLEGNKFELWEPPVLPTDPP